VSVSDSPYCLRAAELGLMLRLSSDWIHNNLQLRTRRGLIVIALEGGCEFAFPAALAEGLADAPRSKLSKIRISPNGLGLHWPLLDADLYVPGLIEGAFGSDRWMQQIGKLGGLSRSASKAKASRENGKRGGRPKERAAA
jgi:hypothetical protein